MAYYIRLPALIIAAAFAAGCSNGAAPAKQINPSLGIGIEDAANKDLVTISRDSLDKEFLLQSSLADQRSYGSKIDSPTSTAARSRIVTFQENGSDLLMFESNEGHLAGDELPSHALITIFPVIKSDDKNITFDFNAGMANVVTTWDWYASDYMGSIMRPDSVATADKSYIRETIEDKDSIMIKQILSLWQEGGLQPVEATYYFTRYKENPNFTPAVSPGFEYLGYFEANPIVHKGDMSPTVYISKWDISKPIVFYLSRSIPAEYRAAIAEGILYWNKALGRDVLSVEIVPEGVTAPDFRHNILQWHTNQSAGAYADAQMDPRTGEILHAQIFFSSNLAKLPYYYVIPKEGRDRETKEERDVDELFSELYRHRDLIWTLSPERVLAVTNDFLRLIAAHEMGHVMGLRHNFAASSSGELTEAEVKRIVRQYMKDGTLPDGVHPPANSVMDYHTFIDEILLGAMIKEDALSHDRYAIEWGYYGYDRKPEYAGLLFCTDSHVAVFEDCKKDDAGKHIVKEAISNTTDSLNKIPNLLAEIYIASKANIDALKRMPVIEATPSADRLASSVVYSWGDLLRLLSGDFELRSINSKYPDRTDIDVEAIRAETIDWLDYEIASAGGMDEIFHLIDPETFEAVTNGHYPAFEQLIESDAYQNIPLVEGGYTGFTGEEIEYMKERATKLLPEVADKIALFATAALSRGSFGIFDTVGRVEEKIARWAGYILTSGGERDFKYSIETRRQAAGLLNSGGPYFDWMDKYVPAIAAGLRQKLEAKYGMPIDLINPRNYPRERQKEVQEELGIYHQISWTRGPVVLDY